jgi:hypothetical protein
MLYLYLLTYLLALWRIASSHKVFQKILADQQSSSRTLENQSTNLNTIPILTEMRALLLNSSVILVIKRFGGKFGGLGLQIFILK